ncbi:MAG: hypothetical protein VB032_06375 [Burkholderiaceae bacterium]|nr:hypothetical protein [Burkholderiaceae bacterium]
MENRCVNGSILLEQFREIIKPNGDDTCALILRIALAIPLFSASSSVYAYDWQEIWNVPEGVNYIDVNTVRVKSNGFVEAWTLFDQERPRQIGNAFQQSPYAALIEDKNRCGTSTKMLVSYNCNEKAYKYKFQILYLDNMGRGMSCSESPPVF